MDIDENISQTKQETRASSSKPPQKALSEAAQGVLKQIEALSTSEEKIRIALEFMRNSLSQSGTPRFKDFWDIRGLCLPLFKTAMNQVLRTELWAAYIEISMEARRLKEILDEQSAFAVEQIELAIVALEKDLTDYDLLIQNVTLPDFAENSVTMRSRCDIYENMQRELNLLNALASRVNSLRKEVIRTDMRIKTRSKFFDRLSTLGDHIFPRRKEMIKEISEQFVADVDHFVQSHFSQEEDRKSPPFYVLREEIKALQGVAKELTLSTHAFNVTREQLSQCWDRLREKDKKRKEEMAHKRVAFQENAQLVKEKIAALTSLLEGEGMTLDQARIEAQGIYDFMRTVELGKEDINSLKDEVRALLHPLENKIKSEETERLRVLEEQVRLKQERINSLFEQMQQLESLIATQDMQISLAKKAEIEDLFVKESPGRHERMRFDTMQRRIKDQIADKRAASLLNLSAKGQQALEELKNALKERVEMREEIRQNLENYRKSLGSSGFDFEKAMAVREIIDREKERLAKLNTSIQDLEEKIHEFEE
ncbi:MAG: hypothetical protein KGZ39_02085 [Simkania sp.]|nr:hypothetical protein [Simkania sp.]